MTDELQMTAFHEAAHAVVAVAVGVQVTEASIRPRPGDGILPGSLGHVAHWRHSDPRPEDCWAGSAWFESGAMTTLAGYVIEELLDPEWYFRHDDSDHHRVLDMLREFTPRDADKGLAVLAQLRDRTLSLLTRPEVMVEVTGAADLLLTREQVTGTEFYQALHNRHCSARHPDLSKVRCQKDPHPYGSHWFMPEFIRTEPRLSEPLFWDGLPPPPRNQRVGAMTGSQKRIRAINRGQAPRPLNKAWREAADDYGCNLAGV